MVVTVQPNSPSFLYLFLLCLNFPSLPLPPRKRVRLSGVPKTPLRFEDSLEGLREFGKAVLVVMVDDSESTQMEGSQGKRRAGLCLGHTRLGLLVASQQSCASSAGFSQQQCVTTRLEDCQPGKLTGALVSRFFLGIGHTDMADFRVQCPLPPEPLQRGYHVTQGPHQKSHH